MKRQFVEIIEKCRLPVGKDDGISESFEGKERTWGKNGVCAWKDKLGSFPWKEILEKMKN